MHAGFHEPTALVDAMIDGGELSAFVLDVYERRNERDAWELYLSRPYEHGMSFNQYKECLRGSDEASAMSSMTQEEIIAQTLEITGLGVAEE